MSGVAKAGFAAVGLVLLGFSLGVLADHLWLAHRVHATGPELTHEESLTIMLGSLNMTDQQHESINEIFRRYHANVGRHLEVVHPVLVSTMDSARREIEDLLSPQQLVAFRDWIRVEHERLDSTPPSPHPH